MENIISKELLSEVIDFVNPIDEVGNINAFDNTFYVTFKNQCGKNINIYELAHKCKEWANEKGWCLKSFLVWGYDNWTIELDHKDDECFEGLQIFDGAPSEPEAIFKACQWILENKI